VVDGLADISSGDIIQKDLTRYTSKYTTAGLNLLTENFKDGSKWTPIDAGDTVTNYGEAVTNYLGNLANYADDNLGINASLTDAYTQSFARGEKTSVSLSISVLDLSYVSKAEVGDGSIITVGKSDEDGKWQTDDLTVLAETKSDTILLAGNFAPFGFQSDNSETNEDTVGWTETYKKQYKDFKKGLTPNKTGEGEKDADKTEKAIGASIQVLTSRAEALTTVGNITVNAKDLNVASDTNIFGASVSVAGGKGGKLSLNGSWNHTSLTTRAQTLFDARSDVTLSGRLDVIADEVVHLFAFSGVVSKSDKTAVGLSGVTILSDRSAEALLTAETPSAAREFEVNGDMSVTAKSSGVIVLASVAATKTSKADSSGGNPGQTTSTSGAASGAGGAGSDGGASSSKGGWAISGSATALEEDVTVTAKIRNLASLTAGSVTVSAMDNGTRVLVSGAGASASGSSGKGIAGSFVVVDSQKTILAAIEATVGAMALKANGVTIKSNDDSDYFSFSAGLAAASGKDGFAVSGSVIVVVGASTVEAAMRGKDLSNRITLEGTPFVTIGSRNNSNWLQVAGAIAYGGKAGIGVSVAVASLESVVETNVSHIAVKAAEKLGAIAITAVNSLRIDTVAAGVAVSTSSTGSGAGVGMVAINVLEISTAVVIDDASFTAAAANDVTIAALDDSYMGVGAGGLAISFNKLAIGVSVAVNAVSEATNAQSVKRGTEVRITRSSIGTTTGDLTILASSDLDMNAVAVSGAGSKKFALAGSAAVNKNNVGTRVIVDHTSSLVSGRDFVAQALQTSNYVTIAGGVAIALGSGGGSFGAGIAINLITSPVRVTINSNLTVTGDASILATAQQSLLAIAVGGAGSGGFSLGGSVAVTELSGDVSAIANPTDPRIWEVGALTMAAQESSAITSISGAAGISFGKGGIGLAFSFITNTRSVTALLGGNLSVISPGHVTVSAGSNIPDGGINDEARKKTFAGLPDDAFNADTGLDKSTDLNAQMVNIAFALGGSKMVGIGFDLAKTRINRTISATVGSGASVTLDSTSAAEIDNNVLGQTSGLSVVADDSSSIVVVSVGAAAAIGLGSSVAIAIGGSIALSDIDSHVISEIESGATITLNNESDLAVLARNHTRITSVAIGAAVAVGGSTAAGAVGFSVALNKIVSETGARLGGTINAAGDQTGVNRIFVDAVNSSNILSVSVAAAVAATTGKVGFAGGGAGSSNVLEGATYAVVKNAQVVSADQMDVKANSTGEINAVVVGVAVAIAAGNSGAAFALGVAVSINKTNGLDVAPLGLPADGGYLVAARVVDSDITLAGALNIAARSTQRIHAVVVAASVAVAATGGFGLSGAGAGAIANNKGNARVLAEMVGSTNAHQARAGSIDVSAVNLVDINALVGSAAVALSGAGGTGVAVSVAIALASNTIDANTTARIAGFTGVGQLYAGSGAITVAASTSEGSTENSPKLKITATSVAASVAIAGASGMGFAIAGAGANALNTITGGTFAELNEVEKGVAGSVSVTAVTNSEILATVVAASVALGIGGSSAGAAAIGGVYVSNVIGVDKGNRFTTFAGMKNASMTIAGLVDVTATNTSAIDATAVAAAGAVSVSSNLSGSLAGAGSAVYNEIYSSTRAEVERTASKGDRTMFLDVGSLNIAANDTSAINTISVGAALAVAVGGVGGAAVSIGVAIANNDVAADAKALLQDSALSTNPFVKAESTVAGSIKVSAVNNSTVDAKAIAASVAVGGGAVGGLALSGAGAAAKNNITNVTDAVVRNAQLRTVGNVSDKTADEAGDILVTANSTTRSTSKVVAAAVALSAGKVAGAGSIGVSLTESHIGRDELTGRDHVTRALIEGSKLTTAGDVLVDATAIESHHVQVVAASVAIAIGIGGAAAGAGLGIDISNRSNTEALVVNTSINANGTLNVLSNSTTTVNDDIGSGDSTTMIGVAAAVAGVAVAINVSIMDVEVENSSIAKISATSTGKVIDTIGAITVDAKAETKLVELNGVGVAIAAGAMAASGGGLEITLDVANTVTAMIDMGQRANTVVSSGVVTVNAFENVEMGSNVANVSVAAAPIGLAVGAAVMLSRHGSTVTAKIANANVSGNSVAVLAEANLDIKRVDSTGVSVGMVSAVVNESTAQAEALVQSVVDNASLVGEAFVDVRASYDARLRSSTLGIAAGLGAFGSMYAESEAGLTHGYDANVILKNNASLKSNVVNVIANISADLFADTQAGGGGGLVAVLARSTVKDDITAGIEVYDGTTISAGSVTISARSLRSIDGTADASTLALASGAGAALHLESLGDARVDFKSSAGFGNTVITGTFVQIDTFNKNLKEYIVGTGGAAGSGNNVSSGSGNFFGVAAIGSFSSIGSVANKSVSQVNLGTANIVGVGNYYEPSSVIVRALSNTSAADRAMVDAVSGIAGIAIALSDVEINALTDVTMNGAHIDNMNGTVNIETRANMRNTSDVAVFQAGLLSANMGVDASAVTNSTTSVNIANSQIEGKRVEINAGKANGTLNSTVSRTEANGSLVSLGISLGIATMTNHTLLNNTVAIGSGSEILSAGNLVITAENNGDLFQQSSEGLVLVLAVPPYGYPVGEDIENTGGSNVTIDANATLRAGVNYNTVYKVLNASEANKGLYNFPEGAEERALTIDEKGKLGLDDAQDYTIGYFDNDALAVDLYNGDIILLDAANSSTAAGVVGHYYQFIANTSGQPRSLAIQNEDYTNAALWRDLGTMSSTEEQVLLVGAFGSDDNAFIRSAMENQVFVIKPRAFLMPTISVGQLDVLLAAQYAQVQSWMRDHNSNAEALVRYEAQLAQIVNQMKQLGLTPPAANAGGDGVGYLDETIETMFLEFPDIVSSPGSIYITANGLVPSTLSGLTKNVRSGLTGPTLMAHKDVHVTVSSDLLVMTRINDVIIDSAKVARISEATGDYFEFYPGNIYVNDKSVSGTNSNGSVAQVDILINAGDRNEYTYISTIEAHIDELNKNRPDGEPERTVPNLPADLFILGSVVNELGDIAITNASAAIRVSGQILGKTVHISFGGDFTVSTDWYHSGGDPRLSNGVSDFVGHIESRGAGKSVKGDVQNLRVVEAADPITDVEKDLAAYIAFRDLTDKSSVVANGLISIVATYVNINGLIQSGITKVSVEIASTFVPPSYTKSIISSAKSGIAGITFGSINGTQVPLRGRWDEASQAIILNEMKFAGAWIEITGNVFSTGAGQLSVASGYADVQITNLSNYKLILNGIDTSVDREGVIQITDTLKKPAVVVVPNSGQKYVGALPTDADIATGTYAVAAQRTLYTEDAGGIDVSVQQGVIQRDGDGNYQGVKFIETEAGRVNGLSTSYAPEAGTFYIWSEGRAVITQTILTTYVKTFDFIADWPAGAGTEYSNVVTPLGDANLLESQGLSNISAINDLGGWTSAEQDGYEFIGRFKNIANVKTELKGGAVVIHEGVYWSFTGGDEGTTKIEVELSTLFNDGAVVAEYEGLFKEGTTGTKFTETDRDLAQYKSDYKGFSLETKRWTTGGGYLKKKTVWNETTIVEGLKKYWDIGVRADLPISINFLAGVATPSVKVESVGALEIAGDIKTASNAHVFLNDKFSIGNAPAAVNGGSILSTKNVSVSGVLQTIHTRGSVNLTTVTFAPPALPSAARVAASSSVAQEPTNGIPETPAGVQPYNITSEDGDIFLRRGSDTNSDGNLVVGHIEAKNGSVFIIAPQGIFAENSDSVIIGKRVELQSSDGPIGTENLAIRIDTDGDDIYGGFAGASMGGLFVTEINGDLNLVKPQEIKTSFLRPDDTGPISVGSLDIIDIDANKIYRGIVELRALTGSIYDFNFEDDATLTNQRLLAFKDKMGLSDGNRAVIGATLDSEVHADYQKYIDYWDLIRFPLGASSEGDLTRAPEDIGAVSSDITTLTSFQNLVVNTAKTQKITEAEAKDQLLVRFEDIHAVNHDKPFTDTRLYQQYYAVIWQMGESVDLADMSTFKAEVSKQLVQAFLPDVTAKFSNLNDRLADVSVDTDSAAADYISKIHSGQTEPDRTLLQNLTTFVAYIDGKVKITIAGDEQDAERQTLIDDGVARFGALHQDLWNYSQETLIQYVSVIRAEHLGSALDSGSPIQVSVMMQAKVDFETGLAAGDYDALLSDFSGVDKSAEITSALTYKYAALHLHNKTIDQASTYQESLYLKGDARETAIDTRLAMQADIDGALSSSVAKELYPLLFVSSISGGASAAAENANIIGTDVRLYALGDVAKNSGKIGTLTEAVSLDFTRDLNTEDDNLSAEEIQDRLDDQEIRRGLQTQDIVDQVYQLYTYNGATINLVEQPTQGEMAGDPTNWTPVSVTFATLSGDNPATVAPGGVYAIWGVWPGGATGEPQYTYKLFQQTGTTPISVRPQDVAWADVSASNWVEIPNVKNFAKQSQTLHVETGQIVADVWEVLRVSARPFADVNLRAIDETAATKLHLNSKGMSGIGHDGATLNVELANSGGFLRLVTTGNMYDVSFASSAAAAEGYISLIAGGEIGANATPFRVNVEAGSVLLLQSGQSANIEQKGGHLIVERALVGGDFTLRTPSTLSIGKIEANGVMTIHAGGTVSDRNIDDLDASTDIIAQKLVLDVIGDFGSVENRIEVDIREETTGKVTGVLYLTDIDIFALGAAGLTITGAADIKAFGSIRNDLGGTLSAGTMTLKSSTGNVGSPLASNESSQSLDILITAVGGTLTATAANDIWIKSAGAVAAKRLVAGEAIVVVISKALTDASNALGDPATFETKLLRLSALALGSSAKVLRTKVDKLAFDTTTGIYLSENDNLEISENYIVANQNGTEFWSGRAREEVIISTGGSLKIANDVRILNGKSGVALDLNIGTEYLQTALVEVRAGDATINGQSLTIQGTTLKMLDGSATLSAIDSLVITGGSGGITSSKSITLNAGDTARFDLDTMIDAKETLNIVVDTDASNETTDAAGGQLNLLGNWNATTINVTTGADADVVNLTPQTIHGNVVVKLGADQDLFTLTNLNARSASESFLIDGQGAADEFIVNRAATPVSYNITFEDSGARDDGADFLTVNGRNSTGSSAAEIAAASDIVLLRKNFIALMNDGESGLLAAFERINYDGSINGRVRINGLGGEDRFYSDDTSAMVTLDGGADDDLFQIGQMFGSDRVEPNVATGDEIATNETTQGFLSVGNSLPMVVFGGLGEDVLNVYSNKALTKLFGEDGDDLFVVRAFILKGSTRAIAGGGDTELFGGGGADEIMYNMNAPLKIDGGAGIDKIVVLGTEGADSFMITENGIYGAGLNISFEGIELAEVDGLEGDDTFYVISTSGKIATTIIGGLGNDTINVGGDVMTDIVSLEVEGTSAIVNHSVLSDDEDYNEVFVDGVQLNIASATWGIVEIDDSDMGVLSEGGAEGFYLVRLVAPVTQTAYLTVSAARSSTQDDEGRTEGPSNAQSVLVSSTTGAGYESANVLTFGAADWDTWQKVYVQAPDDDAFEGTRTVVISHTLQSDDLDVQRVQIQNKEVTVFDNDLAGVLVSGNINKIDLTESGVSQTLKLRLSRAPAAGEIVTITASGTNADFGTDVPSISFTSIDWDVEKDLNVRALSDFIPENRELHLLELTVDSNKDTSDFKKSRQQLRSILGSLMWIRVRSS
jgi:hypothetical protein